MTKVHKATGFVFAFVGFVSAAFGQSAWRSRDIGPSAPGTTYVKGTTITIQGNGADIYGTADSFRYVYQLAEGDCEIRARLVYQQETHEWARAGLMIRQSLAAGSRHVHIDRNPGLLHGLELQYRTVDNGLTNGTYSPHLNALPRWLRLVRTGNAFQAYYALDVGGRPGNWLRHGVIVPVTMSDPVHIGLSCLSRVNGTLSTVVFDNVQTTGTLKMGAGFIIGQVPPPSPPPRPAGVLARAWASLFGPDHAAMRLGPLSGRPAIRPSVRLQR